jgi:hypothetical protein
VLGAGLAVKNSEYHSLVTGVKRKYYLADILGVLQGNAGVDITLINIY